MSVQTTLTRTAGRARVPGVSLRAFIHNDGAFFLTEVGVYKDGMVDAWGLLTFEQFVANVRSGWVTTELPRHARVSIFPFGDFKLVEGKVGISADDLIAEVADVIERLNDRPDSPDRCFTAWERYRAAPTAKNRAALRKAYEAVPAHNRPYILQDQDSRDAPIREALYGKETRSSKKNEKPVEASRPARKRRQD